MADSGSGWVFLRRIKSVLAAMFGVQSDANRERDFEEGKPIEFILYGLVAVLVFILCIYGVVRLVLSQAGA